MVAVFLLSYKGGHSKRFWECAKGHQWEAAPTMIKSGTWCPKCGIESSSAKRRSSIEEMQKLAEERGGRCLSPAYKGGHSKLLWECSKGHQWEATPANIRRGSWCPKCGIESAIATRRLSIGENAKNRRRT